ncbi:carboxypeptidase-like regulatory domain-containing protein [Pedobacter sp. AW31-3R]|uniref:carboxypeptidase-like regulatory domain-containing protein n=1 Tax=Pedobacter sp. AW31-3R TaxID=3445781 RepID=UPI003F9F1E99
MNRGSAFWRLITYSLLTLSCLTHELKAQTRDIHGIVVNKENSTWVPGVTITVSQSSVGTKTDEQGRFNISIPAHLKNELLLISSIGYQTQKILISQISPAGPLEILLSPVNIPLQEVKVHDETAQDIVFHAYRNKLMNYPIGNTVYKGFYRETNYSSKDNSAEKLNYVIEAVINLNKGSYKDHSEDEIGIEELRKNELLPVRSAIQWYGGAYTPSRFDIVKKEFEFLDPGKGKNYGYEKAGTAYYYGKLVHRINFKPRIKARYEGTLYIDVESYAIVKADFRLFAEHAQAGNTLKMAKITDRAFKVNYQPFAGKWYLQSIWQQAIGKERLSNGKFRYVTEYATTSIDTNRQKKFEYHEKLSPAEVLSSRTSPYNDEFWKSYDVVRQTKGLNELLIDTARKVGMGLDNKGWAESMTARKNFFHRLQPVFIFPSISHVTIPYDVSFRYTAMDGMLRVDHRNALKNGRLSIGVGYGFDYSLNAHLSLRILAVSETGDLKNNIYEMGIRYQKIISQSLKRPVRLVAGLDYSYNTFKQRMHYTFSGSSLQIEGENFPEGFKIHLMSKQHGIRPVFGMNLDINKVLTVFAEGSLLLRMDQQDDLRFTKKSSNLFQEIFPSEKEVALSSSNAVFSREQQQVSRFPFLTQFSIRTGLRGYLRFRH